MKSLRNIASTFVFSIAALALSAGVAGAQTARGVFTLPHEVSWQEASVPAGEYQFSLDAKGPSQLMTIRKLDGARIAFMLLVNKTGPALPSDTDRLVLVSKDGKSYVETMTLPDFGLTLHFNVPSGSLKKELALAGDHPEPTRTR